MTRWPGGARGAVAFTFDFDAEEVWIGDDPANADRPGVLSQGTYGAKVGVPLILEMLERQDLRQTFFIPGRVAERYPERVGEIRPRATRWVTTATRTHRRRTSSPRPRRPSSCARSKCCVRWARRRPGIARRRGSSRRSRSPLLQQHGFTYSSNYMDDLHPYTHEGSDLVELPIQWLLDDAPYFWFSGGMDWTRTIQTPSHVREIWTAELDGIVALGGSCIITMHPQIIGRPHRLKFLDEFIGEVKARGDVWIASCAEIASAWAREC